MNFLPCKKSLSLSSRSLLTCVALLSSGVHQALAQEGTIATIATMASRPSEAELGDVFDGRIDRAGEVDVFAVTVAAGTTIDLEVTARSIGSPLDPTLTFSDESGTRLAHKIDFDGLGGRIRFTVPNSGRYLISVRGFGGSGGSKHTYRLTIGTSEERSVASSGATVTQRSGSTG